MPKLMHPFPVVCIVAPGSGYGKTWLIEYLVKEISASGKGVCVLKHSGHDFSPDEGKDTQLHRRAGAKASAVLTKGGTLALFAEGRSMEGALSLLEALRPDVVLCEGFKSSHYPKVLLLGNTDEFGILPALENVIAVLSDSEAPEWVKVPVIRRKEEALSVITEMLSAGHGGGKA